MTDWQGEPLCVIETKTVAIVPFEEAGEELAATEGEAMARCAIGAKPTGHTLEENANASEECLA